MALVGIARLAADSQLLESKRTVEYLEIPTRSILNRADCPVLVARSGPFDASPNIFHSLKNWFAIGSVM